MSVVKSGKLEGQKLISALYELSKENFIVSDDTILNKLYVHLKEKASESDFLDLIPDFGILLEHVLKLWHGNKLCGGVKVFFVRLIGLVGSSSLGFVTITTILPEIKKMISSTEVQDDSDITLPLLDNLELFLNHEDGLQWVLITGVWKHAVKIFLDNRSMFLNRSAIKIIFLLLSKVCNKDNDVEMLNSAFEPLVENHILSVTSLKNPESDCCTSQQENTDTLHAMTTKEMLQIKNFARSAKYVCEILDELFLHGHSLQVKFNCNITKDFKVDNSLSRQEWQTVYQLLVMVELSNVCWDLPGPDTVACPLEGLYRIVHDATRSLMFAKHFHSLMDFCVFCLWRIHHFRDRIPNQHNYLDCERCRELESMLVYQMKIFAQLYSFRYSRDRVDGEGLLDDENDEIYICFNDVDNNKIRLSKTSSFECFQLGVSAIGRSLKFILYPTSRDAIATVVVYSLSKMMQDFWVVKASAGCSPVNLITLASKITEHCDCQFLRKELVSTAAWILDNKKDNPMVTISTLQLLKKLIEIEVVHNLGIGPATHNETIKMNMSAISDSLMKNLKNNASWEIRDTILEVYQLAARIAELNPRFFNYFCIENLYDEVLEMASLDKNDYVRASAFKLLSTVVRAKLFLEKLSSEDLSSVAIKTLLEDKIPENRMAACELLSGMYVTDFVADEGSRGKLCDAVFIASRKDMFWEVKKATLQFWQCVMTKRLAAEGVPADTALLDCPKHPASKEDVVLKLIRVMDLLSDLGCFTVLWMDLDENNDISVSQEASCVIQNILDLDSKWNFIERITNNFDVETDEENLTNNKLSSRDFFIKICQKDWKENLTARKLWLEDTCDNMFSLLDHILNAAKNTGDRECNAIDCY